MNVAVTGDLSLGGDVAAWLTSPGEAAVGLLGDTSKLVSGSAKVYVDWRGALVSDDRLRLTVSQPLRVEYGYVDAAVSRGLDQFGNLLWDEARLNLAPSSREIAMEVSWTAKLGGWSAETRLAWRENAGHARGATDRAAMLYMSRSF